MLLHVIQFIPLLVYLCGHEGWPCYNICWPYAEALAFKRTCHANSTLRAVVICTYFVSDAPRDHSPDACSSVLLLYNAVVLCTNWEIRTHTHYYFSVPY